MQEKRVLGEYQSYVMHAYVESMNLLYDLAKYITRAYNSHKTPV